MVAHSTLAHPRARAHTHTHTHTHTRTHTYTHTRTHTRTRTRTRTQLKFIRGFQGMDYDKARVGQNHIYTMYIRYFWQGNHHTYGHIRCVYTVLANPRQGASSKSCQSRDTISFSASCLKIQPILDPHLWRKALHIIIKIFSYLWWGSFTVPGAKEAFIT